MHVQDVPAHIDHEHGLPITPEKLRSKYGDLSVRPPEGEPRPLADLIDRCRDHSDPDTFRSRSSLRNTLLCYADRSHVGREAYDDRGNNPMQETQVSF